jgi:hypothetical protein
MEARIIGPASELGVFESLEFYGQPLTREWSKIDMPDQDVEKLKANRYVELRDGKAKAGKLSTDTDVEDETIKARLDELGVEYSPKASPEALKRTLEKAEKAKAKQDEEEAEVLAEAARIQNEQAQ